MVQFGMIQYIRVHYITGQYGGVGMKNVTREECCDIYIYIYIQCSNLKHILGLHV